MKKVKIVVVGGGWGGCAAAVGALKAGADVTLLERTDMLLGTGLVGGIYRNNGRYTAAEEMIAMGGGGDLFRVMDRCARHKDIEFPGHKHASLYARGLHCNRRALLRFQGCLGSPVGVVFRSELQSRST